MCSRKFGSCEERAKLFETIFTEIDANIDRSIDPLIDFPYEKVLIHSQLFLLEVVLRSKGEGEILDIGSGFGHVPAFFSQLGYNAIGGDPFPREYTHKIWNALSKKYGCGYAKFDGRCLPFKNESFDIITFLGVLEYVGAEHLDSKQETDLQFSSEVRRVLKTDGILLIGDVPNRYSFFKFPTRKLRTLPKGYTTKEIRSLLHVSGFRIIKAWRGAFLPARVRRISPVLEKITSRMYKIYLLVDGLLSQTFLGTTSTNLHYILVKSPKSHSRTNSGTYKNRS